MSFINSLGKISNMSNLTSKIGKLPKRLLVCDMAGTTVNEKGIVYDTIFKTVNPLSTEITRETIHKWHGVKKIEVLTYFANKYNGDIEKLDKEFNDNLLDAYQPGNIDYIHSTLPDYFANLQKHNFVIALNTSYPRKIQQHIIKTLKLNEIVDDRICADDVKNGRPHPDMIQLLMTRNYIKSPKDVCKVDDTSIGILEGKSAGCYKVCGVLSGGDSEKELKEAGADMIYPKIVDVGLNDWFDTSY